MPILLPPQNDPNAALDRLAAYLKQSFSVAFTVTRSDMALKATGTLTIQRPRQMRFSVKFAGEEFESATTPAGSVDLSRTKKTFMRTGPLPQLYQPSVHFSPIPDLTFPGVLMVGDLRTYMPSAGTPKLMGSEAIDGVDCDRIKSAGYEAWIAKDGRLMRLIFEAPSERHTAKITTDFRSYKSGVKFPDSTFALAIPAGYRAYALPRETLTFPVGSLFPLEGWQSTSGPLPKGKSVLIVATAPDCVISGKAAKALDSLRDVLPVWVLGDDKPPTGLEGLPFATLPGQRALDRLFVPATPYFYLVDGAGKVKRMWLGFDEAESEAFVNEVITAAKQ